MTFSISGNLFKGIGIASIGALILSPDTLFMRWSEMDVWSMLANIDQTSISDHLMKRVSGDKIKAPILAIPIPLKRFPDIEKVKFLPKN